MIWPRGQVLVKCGQQSEGVQADVANVRAAVGEPQEAVVATADEVERRR